jgi:hypothetical protein
MKRATINILITLVIANWSCTLSKKSSSKDKLQVELKILATEDFLYANVINNTSKEVLFSSSSLNNQKPLILECFNNDSSSISTTIRQFRIPFEKALKISQYLIIPPRDSIEFKLNSSCSCRNIKEDSCIVQLVYDFKIRESNPLSNKERRKMNKFIKRHNIWLDNLTSNIIKVPKEVVFNYCGCDR